MQTTQTQVLTLSDLGALEVLARAAQTCARVRWLDDGGEVRGGTARHFVKSADNCGFIDSTSDVRDAVLRITTDSGFEWFPRVRSLMLMVKAGEFVLDS